MTTAVRIAPAGERAHALVVSNRPAITGWSLRYFAPWWTTTATDVFRPSNRPTVDARVDASHRAAITRMITDYDHADVTYAGARTLVHEESDGTVYAAQPAQRLAYHSIPAHRWLAVSGQENEPVALAAARLARDLIRAQLLGEGWVLLHASAVVRDGQALLTVGSKGAGKSTVATTLARQDGWDLLANDRVFARPEPDGTIHLLPWPAAAALGFGLLDGLGLYDIVRHLFLSGEQLHPTQHPQVTHALTTGDRAPQWNDAKSKELKCQFFPDQLVSWLGCTLTTHATAAAVLHPRISAALAVPQAGDTAELGEADFFSAATEDRYPDLFHLAANTRPDPAPVRERLAALPCQSVILGHDADANTDALARLADTLVQAG
ncbi:hypothetical protein AB0I22_19445 [Streptomyces sp. NPDC050610]|uniref:hypothetical protein n=1 Tax=Streptomyces sp. NPDC050610 TaxID=3157097 RepID=UPI00342EAAC7